MEDNFVEILKDVERRVNNLEKQTITSLNFGEGLLVIPVLTADPTTPIGGQMYYNSVTGKFRKYDAVAGSWKNFESA